MSCNVTKIDLCFLISETFSKPHFKFNVEVLNDQFLYIIKDRSGEVFRATQDDNIELSANDIYITNIDLKIGEYTHELVWTRNGIARLIFQGKVNVRAIASDSCCDDSELSSSDIVLIEDQTVYEITFSQGEDGKDGIDGKDGEPGPKGEDGPEGPRGKEGPKGDPFVYSDFTPEQLALLKGPKGEKGERGEIGAKGDSGAQGIQGPKGDKGDQGTQGDQGIQGFKGEAGSKGDVGPVGEKGDTGLQGEKGVKGDTGEKGEKGIQGNKGEKGEAGQNIIDQNTKTPIMIWTGTKVQYDAVLVKDPATLYIIKP